MSDGCFSLCTGGTGRGEDGLLVLINVSLLFFNRCANFLEQVEKEVSVIRVSLCVIITHRSANQKVDNRRQIKSVSGQSSNGAFD